jgi:hypothetical protein
VVLYLDASALIRLIQRGKWSEALEQFLDTSRTDNLVTSVVSEIEIGRVVWHAAPSAPPLARRQLGRCHQIPLDARLLRQSAMTSPGQAMRNFESIHLTSAKSLGHRLRALVTYEESLARTALTWGLPVRSP